MKGFVVVLFLLSCGGAFSQSSGSSVRSASVSTKPDKMPEYPGGNKALIKILLDSVDDPAVRWEDADETPTKIVLTFTIDEKGNVSDVVVEKSIGKAMDAKFISAIKKLKFIPGIQNGKPVKLKYTLPFEVDFGERTKY